MKNGNKVYIVTAYRYGNREMHSYVIGAFSKKDKALKAADNEEDFRGGKYECSVEEWEMDVGGDAKMDPQYKAIKDIQPSLGKATINARKGMEDELRELIGSVSVDIDTSYQAPDAFSCPFCGKITLEHKGANTRDYNAHELMDVIEHKDDCPYVKAKLLTATKKDRDGGTCYTLEDAMKVSHDVELAKEIYEKGKAQLDSGEYVLQVNHSLDDEPDWKIVQNSEFEDVFYCESPFRIIHKNNIKGKSSE